jgi:hypothetical protein
VPKGKVIRYFHCNKTGHRRDGCFQLTGNKSGNSNPNNSEIPEVEPVATGEPLNSSLLAGASGNELLLEVEVEGEFHQFLVDSGASLSLVKPGVSQAEVCPTNTAARGITGIKLKSLGTQIIEIKLGKKIYTHESVLTPLDVEYSGVLGLDIFRLMEAKIDLCSGGLIVGWRRHELTGLDCPDRDSSQVFVMKPVVDEGRGTSELITP